MNKVIFDSMEYQILICILIGIIFRWGFLLWELIFIYLLRTFFFVLILVVFFLLFFFCFFFHYVSAKFHLWPSSGDLKKQTYQDEDKKSAINKN